MQDDKDAEVQRERLVAAKPLDQMQLQRPQHPIGGNFCGFQARYLFAVLAAVSFAIIYGLKVNLSVCIVVMVNQTYVHEANKNKSDTASNSGAECPAAADMDHSSEGGGIEDGPFDWDEVKQGLLLGSYFWGYILSEIPGGIVAERWSARWVMFAAVFVNVVGTLLTPIAAYWYYEAFVAIRVLEGLGGGCTFPAMHVMISHWAPPHDRALLTSIIYAGTALGTVVSFPMSGLIAGTLGWEWVFYIMGSLAAVWLILWIILIKDTPEEQYFITEEERNMIIDTIGDHGHHATKFPWKAMFTSMPFYAILVCHFCGNIGWYMLLTQLPTYMKNILHFPIKKNAGLSAVPYFCMWLFTLVLSKGLEKLEDKGVISQTGYRKIATAISSILGSGCLVGVTFVGCDAVAAVILMTFAVTFMGAMFVGYLGNHIDIAHHYAGSMMAVTNTIATIPGIAVPPIVGYLTEGNQTIARWRGIFFGTFGINLFLFLFYMKFGTGVEQPWNKID